jgi:hypothetical protein
MTMLADLGRAARDLARRPAFTVVTALTLALGIGAVTSVVTVADAVIFSASPYADADRHYILKITDGTFPEEPLVASQRRVQALIASNAIEDAIMWDTFPVTAVIGERPISLETAKVTPNTFAFLGVPPLLGQTFTGTFDDVFVQPPPRVVVLGYRFWQQTFGGAADVIGRALQLDRVPHVIVGVMPEHFRFLDKEVYLPLPTADSPSLSIVRVAPATSPAAAATELDIIDEPLRREFGLPRPEAWRLSLTPARDDAVGHLVPAIAVLGGAMVLLLVIGCINVSIALVARGLARLDEFHLRAALGASASRLFRQLLSEALVLSLAGGAAGVVLA